MTRTTTPLRQRMLNDMKLRNMAVSTRKPVFPRCRSLWLTLCADSAIRIRDIEAMRWAGYGGCDG